MGDCAGRRDDHRSALPVALYRAEQTQALDACAIDQFGVAGITLMERAGSAAFAVLRQRWPNAQRIAVLCGGGNNGGDGFVVARLAHEQGLRVTLMLLAEPDRLQGEARQAWQRLPSGLTVVRQLERLTDHDVIVDALLGTGLQGEVREPWRGAIAAINAAGVPVLALDIPSGLHADTGGALGVAVRAEATISFIGLKQGLLTGAGPAYTGELFFDALAVPDGVYATQVPAAERIDYARVRCWFAPRSRVAHKGDHGHVLVIGGEQGMAGAARLAAEAAARSGAGLVSVATRSAHAAVISAQRPELMCRGVEQVEALAEMLARASVLVLGPGLGQSPWAESLWQAGLHSGRPLVLDADGLNLLAQQPQRDEHWVLTPHPGEAARLLGWTTAAVQADRFAAVVELQRRYGGCVVLKGAGTLIADGMGRVALCSAGNPGMASGGMGDVLSGIIGALLAQGFAPYAAACAGVVVHAEAADRGACTGERGLLASDLLAELRVLVNP